MTARPECVDYDGSPTPAVSLDQFNAAFTTGGLDCVARTTAELTGLEIDHAALMTWGGVIEITNAIGGVTVCVEERIPRQSWLEADEHTGLHLEPGEHELAGDVALQFLRVRGGVGDGSDLARISNQQVYMGALVRKLVSEETFTSVPTLLRLAKAVTSNVVPSSGLKDPMTIVSMARTLAGIPLEDYAFIQFPATAYEPDPNKVSPDMAAWEVIMQKFDDNEPIILNEEEPEATETPSPADTPEPTDPQSPTQAPLPSNLRGSNANDGAADCLADTGLF